MKMYDAQDVRNVVLVGAQGDGKTSLAEALLFNAGVTSRMGRVDEGNTVCDHAADEIERKISIHLSTAFFEHKGRKVNLLVAPGYADFVNEALMAMAVADAAILVVGGDTGVTAAVENVWGQLQERKLPVLVFVNKLDRENIDFFSVVRGMKERLGNHIVDVLAPDRPGVGFSSVISLLQESVPVEDRQYRDSLVEEISSGDDALTDEYLEGKNITGEELSSTLKKEIVARAVVPLLCGSAARNIGVRELADFIVDYLPSPPNADAMHPSAFVFKTVSEPGAGHMNLVKVLSGTFTGGSDLCNVTRRTKERIGPLCMVCGRKKIDAAAVGAGDIAALLKLRDTRTNDFLGDDKLPVTVPPVMFEENVYECAVAARSKEDEEKIGAAMAAISLETPGIRYYYNADTHEMLLSGMGALQLEIIARKIQDRHGIEVRLATPRLPYRETVHGRAEAQGKYKRQSGGRGQYGDCRLRVEPLGRGEGIEFVDKIAGGAIPRNYIPAVEKGVREAMEQGVVAGYPVVDIRVTLFDGSYHEVDSSDMAFKIAGAMALRKAVTDARPVILEPLMNVEVVIPDEYMGAVMGDLNSRRGKVQGIESAGRRQIIRAQVPQAEMFRYAADLRSITKGSGKFSMKFALYEEMYADRAQSLVGAYQQAREAVAAAR